VVRLRSRVSVRQEEAQDGCIEFFESIAQGAPDPLVSVLEDA
jgi:hypothetical protein